MIIIYRGKSEARDPGHQSLHWFPWEQHLHTWLQHGEDLEVYIPEVIAANSLGLQLFLAPRFLGQREGTRCQDICVKSVSSLVDVALRGHVLTQVVLLLLNNWEVPLLVRSTNKHLPCPCSLFSMSIK